MKITDFILLLVEDDPDHVVLIKRALAQANLVNPLHVAEDGEQAIAYLSGQGDYSDRTRYPLPSLILLDLRLPRVSGLDVLRWLRSQPHLRSIPVIVLTSSTESQDVDQAYELGVNSYLQKPVGFDALIEMMKSIGMYWVILNKSPKEASGPAKGKKSTPESDEKGLRILLLDEDMDFARAMTELLRLRKPSIRVDVAKSPSDALKRLATRSHDAFVFDRDQAAGEVAGFLSRVKALVPDLPIVALTVGEGPVSMTAEPSKEAIPTIRKQAKLSSFTTELHAALLGGRSLKHDAGPAPDVSTPQGPKTEPQEAPVALGWADTDILGRQHFFKKTSWDLVRSASTPEALDGLMRIYWKPLYFFVRQKGFDNESAKDIVQEFLMVALERNMISKADPNRGRFRTFLLAALTNFIRDRARTAAREKRGGGQAHFSFDFETSEREFTLEVTSGSTPDEILNKTWARSLLEQSISELKGSPSHIQAFHLQIKGLDIATIARETELTESAVKTAVHRMKQQLRDILRGYLCKTMSSEEEIELEMSEFASLLR